MNNSKLSPAIAAIACFAVTLPAQEDLSGQRTLVAPVTPAPVQPVPQQWIVHFANRPFDLEAVHDAIREGQSVDAYGKTIATVQQEATARHAGFVQAVQALGGTVLMQYWIVDACAIEIADRDLDAVKAMANVARVVPNYATFEAGRILLPIKTATNSQNHGVDALQSVGLRGAGVTVAIVDTGLDSDMAGTGRPHRTFFPDGDPNNTSGAGIGGSRLLSNQAFGTAPADHPPCGHGTGVAGVAAGGNWGIAGADHGHAYEAGVAGYSIADPFLHPTYCSTTSAITAAAWQGVLADKVQLQIGTANMSYHQATNDPLDIGSMAMDEAARLGDILICTIAGNNTTDLGSPAAVNAISVGSVTNDLHDLASSSGRGPRAFGEVFPDLCANGVNTVMPQSDNEGLSYIDSGTSFASPQVCGTATILRSSFPSMQAPEVKAVLLASAGPMPGTGFNQVNGQGCGYLKSAEAFRTAASQQKHGMATLTTGSPIFTRTLHVQANGGCAVAIAWFRPDVNSTNWADLSIRITDGAGNTIAASLNPQRNTEEFVRFRTPITTTYRLEVSGTGVPANGQSFGWAATCPTTP